jgi:hypothetical protein
MLAVLFVALTIFTDGFGGEYFRLNVLLAEVGDAHALGLAGPAFLLGFQCLRFPDPAGTEPPAIVRVE